MNENEIWLPIEGYKGLYEVSNLGRVKSLANEFSRKEKILRQIKNNKGYLFINLYKEGKMKNCTVHRLVANAFIPNTNNYPYVNHKDENPSNNCVDNLEWCDAKYNINYGTCINRRVSSTDYKVISRKVAEKISKQVYQFDLQYNIIKIWQSTQECGRNGFCQSHIAACCRGERKSHKGFIWSYKDISKKQEN